MTAKIPVSPSNEAEEDMSASELLKRWESMYPRFLTVLTVVQGLNLSLGWRIDWENTLGIPQPEGWQLLVPTLFPLGLALLLWIIGQLSPRRKVRVICSSLAWLPLVFIAITVFYTWIALIALYSLFFQFIFYFVFFIALIALIITPMWTDRAAHLYLKSMREKGKTLDKRVMPFTVIASRLLVIPIAIIRYQWGPYNTLILIYLKYTSIDPIFGNVIMFTTGLLISLIYPVLKRKELFQIH